MLPKMLPKAVNRLLLLLGPAGLLVVSGLPSVPPGGATADMAVVAQLFALNNLEVTKIGSLVLNLSRLAVDLLEIGRYRRPRSHPSRHLVSFLFPVFVELL